MKILAIEPYYGGSHKAYLDGWKKRSKHDIEIINFPAYKWKWRMRHSSLSAALKTKEILQKNKKWDLLFSSDMLNLPEYLGLVPAQITSLPKINYFHENQLTYPNTQTEKRDMHFAYSNFLTAAAADRNWFNTAWHRDTFFKAMYNFLHKMPDFQHTEMLTKIATKCEIFPQAICQPEKKRITVKNDNSNTLHITWAARWEHDKNPEDLYRFLQLLSKQEKNFSLSIIGESFSNYPQIFKQIKKEFSQHIHNWGYQSTKANYEKCLQNTDIIISTAIHEFFGISIIEGCACGAIPLAPNRLAYPEVLEKTEEFLYDNTPEKLTEKVLALHQRKGSAYWKKLQKKAIKIASNYYWENIIKTMDDRIEEIVSCPR